MLSVDREFSQTLAADHSAQMVCVIVWRCEAAHRAAETELRRRSSPVHPEMTHVLPCAIASVSPHTLILCLLLSSILSSVLFWVFFRPRSL